MGTTVEIMRAHGLPRRGLIEASADDWDRYHSLHWQAAMDWALENPGHPDTGRLNDPAGQRRNLELDRRYQGWAIFVARNGLEDWRPVVKGPFPLGAADVQTVDAGSRLRLVSPAVPAFGLAAASVQRPVPTVVHRMRARAPPGPRRSAPGYPRAPPRGPVASRLASGVPVLLDIDLAGASQVRAAIPGALLVYLAPPSEVGLGPPAGARECRPSDFDITVVNTSVEDASAQLVALITGQPASQPAG